LLEELAETLARASSQGATAEQLALAAKLVMALAPGGSGSGAQP
jgi:hypothetical protein